MTDPDPSPETSSSPAGTGGDLPTVLVEQIDQHVLGPLRARLEGLSDEEYFWDPTGDGEVWTLHPQREADPERPHLLQGGAGELVIDFEAPVPEPAPFTTIAWRLGHVIVGVLAMRSHSHLGGPPADYMSWTYATTAAGALEQFDTEYERWMRGVRGFDHDRLQRAVGSAEGPYAESSMATLVAHLNRELIHHLAEIALLRDLYVHRG